MLEYAYYVIHIITRAIVYNSSLYRVDFDLIPENSKAYLFGQHIITLQYIFKA